MRTENNFYETLGVSQDASNEDIKRAYRQIAKETHPDVNPDNPEKAEQFKEASVAFAVLSDPTKRAAYDRSPTEAMWDNYSFTAADMDKLEKAIQSMHRAAEEAFNDMADAMSDIAKAFTINL